MARNTSPKKRKHGKPGKPGISPAANRIPYRVYPKRFLVSVPHENNDHPPAEFFYDSQEEAVRQCVTRGPQFFLDTQRYPPVVNIIRGFEPPADADDPDGDALIEPLPADAFINCTELGIISISFAPWDKTTDNWADSLDYSDDDEYGGDDGYELYDPFRFTGKIPGL